MKTNQKNLIAAIAVVNFLGLASAINLSSATTNALDSTIISTNSASITSPILNIEAIDNASQRFFRQGRMLLEEEIGNLQQQNQLDDSILTIDLEVIDDSEEIQQLDQPTIKMN